MPDLAAGGAWTRVRLRWRRDPLTGASARILTGEKLQPSTRPDLTELTAKPAFCPFDSESLETATVPFPAELTAEGRIRVGQAVVVPNIMAYATHSAVGIYDPGRHFIDLDEMTPALVGDALTAMVRHAQAVRRVDPAAQWSSINANYLPPAGASLIHPHLQSAHDAHGLTGQRLLVERSRAWKERHGSYWAALVEQESVRIVRRRGDLIISETRHGFICANAGIDLSNVEAGMAALLPEDADRSARRLRASLRNLLEVDVGVIISDTFGRPWRRGVTDVAIGCAGVAAVIDLKGTPDANGRTLVATEVCVADELAAAAELVMGKDRGVPAAIVRGVPIGWLRTASVQAEIIRPPEEDLFR